MTINNNEEMNSILIEELKKENILDDYNEVSSLLKEVVNLLSNFDIGDNVKINEKLINRFLITYTIGEYIFYRKSDLASIDNIDDKTLVLKIINKFIAHIVAEENGSFLKGMKPYDHYISTLSTAVMILESINAPLARQDPNFSLINDLFETTFKKISGFTKMMALGLYMDSYVAWRTIHESESTLFLLVNNGDKTKKDYVKHIVYSNMYYTPEMFDDNERDRIFSEEIKKEMAEHDLKSKDMKKFLEYGWLYSCKQYDIEAHPKFKLNFNDGVDELSGLREQYNEFYRGTSEIAHSSSIFFYANEEGIKEVALMLTYESSYRIFKLYMSFMEEYFKRNINERNIVNNALEDVYKISIYLRKKYEEEE